jgi:hypothetical protein
MPPRPAALLLLPPDIAVCAMQGVCSRRHSVVRFIIFPAVAMPECGLQVPEKQRLLITWWL